LINYRKKTLRSEQKRQLVLSQLSVYVEQSESLLVLVKALVSSMFSFGSIDAYGWSYVPCHGSCFS
jgi:hypothetical protein|tara:strand:- start:1082 stop:1279 length:198 start_codon:yes stop_codon:yes gene_type:complete